jgi:hypothetical protein
MVGWTMLSMVVAASRLAIWIDDVTDADRAAERWDRIR